MSTNPTLSICIPTFNRASLLKVTLQNIIEEIDKMSVDKRNKIDICISDNYSTDNTEEIVSEFASISPVKVVFERNPVNMGPDANFLKAVALSTSEYVWLLGSDDGITPGGLDYLYNYILKYPYMDLIFLYPIIYKSDEVTLQNSITRRPEAKEEIVFYNKPIDAALDVIYEAGLISILCFRRIKWNNVNGFERFLGSLYVHQYKFLSMIRDGAKTSWIRSPPLVSYRGGNESILKVETVFRRIQKMLVAFYNIPASVFGVNSKEHFLLSAKNIRLNFPLFFILFQVARMNVKERVALIKLFYKYCNQYPYFWFGLLPVLLFPFGIKGKFLFVLSVDSIAKRFHIF